jgi:tripartite-type tricarboxylate transporter receptor subunit TctC
MKNRNAGLVITVVCLMALASPLYGAEERYPTRQIEFIINFPPGGPLDSVTRIIQPPLQAALGVPIILTTKGGAAGALGTDFVAKAKPDGYTLLSTTNPSLTIAPHVNPQIPYKISDLTPVCVFGADLGFISSKPGAPWKNLEELVEYAKKNPGKLNYGSPGLGTVAYFAMEIFKLSYGLDIVPVHFQGTGPVKNAILGGHVDLAASGFGSMGSLVKAKSITGLVTTTVKRLPDYPDIPTMAEKGFPDACLNIWAGLFAPKQCPPVVANRIGAAMEKIMKDPAVVRQMEAAGFFIDYRNSENTAKLIEEESKTVGKVVQKTGMGK